MNDLFISLFLAPLLIGQGLYTRLTTPKLPEAAGERYGIEGSGLPLKLFILGDSAAAGVGVKDQNQALAGQLIAKLSSHFSIEWRLEAQTGLKTYEAIKKLEEIDAFTTDIVVVSLGVNDVTSPISLQKWLQHQERLRALLVSKFNARQILLFNIPPMNLFPALPQPLRWYLGRRSSAFNSAMRQQALEFLELEYTHIDFPATREFIADDGFHPSHLAYTFWSDIAAKSIQLRHEKASDGNGCYVGKSNSRSPKSSR